ncbi:PREDICTED: PAX3- and PAX7-binding protein 1 [Ceratosolen solmsi marchali]|uniref:PAX3- and PAX7-binding protein 1 n=1 Tax=Ceratosolen solmsi marchali TaxID=326594 RepID=A0AAJ7DT77_9HYME|nr:PREDICTED: PAX3- and PAX7-binding protein 1 [Ceratosolen solmsi marchali]
MSLFNKPKRNIRRRHLNDEEEDNENRSIENDEMQNLKNKMKKKDRPKQTLLSFGEELEEADDGEVFKVKKSSRSRRLMKQLDQERKKKKGEEKTQVNSDSTNISNKQEKDLEIKTDDLVVKIKNTGPIVLNGRDALVAGKDDYTSEDELVENQGHKFKKKKNRSENMKFFLESGCIPDAAMIHAARKRRQKARELGHDYIPIEEKGDEKGISRIVREEDQDRSDDDSQERVNMTVDINALDKEKRRQAFLESQTQIAKLSDEQSEPEEEEWEVQQIKKGVTGAQIAAAQQDSIQYNSLVMGSNQMSESKLSLIISNAIPTAPPPPMIQPPDPTKSIPITVEEVLTKIREKLNNLREVHRRHELNFEAVMEELDQSKKELQEGETLAPEMAQRYKYYQELRGCLWLPHWRPVG